ncbi:MAG: AbrB/MazE/SpoVT family DNA-binding domain-containing protein [Jiangellaceae bacterium]
MARAVLRSKGQITLPAEIRQALHIRQGDDVDFVLTERGVLMRGMTTVPADQAWFWSEEWQAGEREASEDIKTGRGTVYGDDAAFLDSLR